MTYQAPEELVELARNSGMRRVLIITALPLEMEAVRKHVTHVGSSVGREWGSVRGRVVP